jgi:predicted transcriptional regulator
MEGLMKMPWITIKELTQQVNRLKMEKQEFIKRCKELEDAIEKEYGVKVRNEVTEVIVDFDKTELAVINMAICKFMERQLSTDDTKFYLDLRIKIEGLLNQMKE